MSSSVFSLYAYIYIDKCMRLWKKEKERERVDRNVLCAMRVENVSSNDNRDHFLRA